MGQYGCDICGLNLNSEFQLNEHNASKKHVKKAAKLAVPVKEKDTSTPTTTTSSSSS